MVKRDPQKNRKGNPYARTILQKGAQNTKNALEMMEIKKIFAITMYYNIGTLNGAIFFAFRPESS